MSILKLYKNYNENSKIVIKNVLGAFIVKGLSLVVSFITIPVFIQYFNNDSLVLGVWYTLLSLLMWFLNFDLGIGNGIRNYLVKALSHQDFDEAKKIISSGIFSIGILTGILSIIGILIVYCLDWNRIFNVDSSIISSEVITLSATYVFIAVMLRFFLTIVTSIFYALQKSAINNLLALIVSVLQLIYILLSKHSSTEEAILNVSFAYIFISNLPILLAGIIIFFRDLKHCRPSIKCIDKEHIKSIVNIGAVFFLCQVLYMILSNTNEFFITNLYSADSTTEYTFYYKVATFGTMIITLALAPVWSVVTKAQAQQNWEWLNKIYKYIKIGGVLILIVQLMIIPFVPLIMDVWLGKGVVEVNHITSLAFVLYGALFTYSGMLSTIGNGLAMMKPQLISFSIAVIFKIMLLLLFSAETSWVFVMWVNSIVLIPYLIIQQRALNQYFKLNISIVE